MSRGYGHIKEYESKTQELREKGYTGEQIAAKLGFSHRQIRSYYYCHSLYITENRSAVQISSRSNRVRRARCTLK